MKKPPVVHVYHEMTPEEARVAIEEMDRHIAERMAYLKQFGYTSGEGFYVDEDGVPRSIGEDDSTGMTGATGDDR